MVISIVRNVHVNTVQISLALATTGGIPSIGVGIVIRFRAPGENVIVAAAVK